MGATCSFARPSSSGGQKYYTGGVTMPGFSFADPRQQHIHQQLLRLVGPGPAAFFRHACQLMAEPENFPAVTHIVGHCVREVESALRDVLKNLAEPPGPRAEDEHGEDIRRILRALEIPHDRGVGEAWLRLRQVPQKYTHRRGLTIRPPGPEFERFWDEIQDVFAYVLQRFEAKYLAVFELLDQLLAKDSPTTDDAKRFAQKLPQTLVTRNYFFARLEHPAWLSLLREHGYFDSLPAPTPDEEGKTSYPWWPQGEYLAKIAGAEPEGVFKVLDSLPPSDNPLANLTLVRIAGRLEAPHVAALIPRLARWLTSSAGYWDEGVVSELVSRLLEAGYRREALKLASEVLAFRVESAAWSSRSLRAALESWDYEALLAELAGVFLRHDPEGWEGWFQFHLDLLERAVGSSRPLGSAPPEDNSLIWLPDLTASEVGPLQEVIGSSLTRTALELVRQDPGRLERVVAQLEERPWAIFRRIALYLIARFPTVSYALLRKHALNEEWVRWPSEAIHMQVKAEFAQLIRVGFPLLSAEDREIFLGWLEAGPDLDKYRDARSDLAEPPTVEQEEGFIGRWRRDWLALVAEHLDEAWRARLSELTRTHGPPEDLAQPHRVEIVEGPTSPISRDELAALAPEALLEYLERWEPPPDWFGEPSVEGLGRTLTKAVGADPVRFAQLAPQFATPDLDPTYLRALLHGLEQAIRSYHRRSQNPEHPPDGAEPAPAADWTAFDWEGVLELCRFVVGQPDPLPSTGHPAGAGRDPGYRWARGAVADLLRSGFCPGDPSIPPGLRERVWEVLETLTQDPDPTPADEARRSRPAADWLQMAINANRGKAFHGVFHYAVWVARHRETGRLEAVPEVRRVLEAHLDPALEPSLAVRSVYGQHLHTLFWLDPAWAAALVPRVFPLDDTERWQAAWCGYLLGNSPYPGSLGPLEPHYTAAVDRLAHGSDLDRDRHLVERLVEHLLAIYLHGGDVAGRLWARFLEVSPLELRAYALQRAGAWLTHPPKGGYSPEQLGRLRALLEDRIRAARHDPAVAPELAQAGYWLLPSPLGEEWALARLREILEIIGWVEPPHVVFERLEALAPGHQLQAVTCLELMAQWEPASWRLGYFLDQQGRTVLRAALEAGGEARAKAKEAINRFVARGHVGLRELLGPPSKDGP